MPLDFGFSMCKIKSKVEILTMASVAQLVEDIADVMKEQPETVNAYARALIDSGDLPKSSGRAIAQVSTEHIVKLFTAVAVEPKIRETARVVNEYLDMRFHMVPPGAPESISITAGEWLTSLLETIFEKPEDERDAEEQKVAIDKQVTFVLNEPEIEVGNGSSVEVRFMRRFSPFWAGYHKKSTVISCRAFLMLGADRGRGQDYVKWMAD
ncbi:MAG: hypothetical protein K0B00_08310 [Rhodobacteraceae bacterium]|nr:hypothetical protein [Paracoccaceae bacterium]